MYIANMHFGTYRKGDVVPDNLPNNAERLERGLIREIKIIKPVETKGARNVERKPKATAKPSK